MIHQAFNARRPSSYRTMMLAIAFMPPLLALTLDVPLVAAAGPKKAISEGDKAPDFELPIQGQDAYVTLSELVKDGPVAVIVLRGYPGYQCGICNRQVGSMVNRAKALGTAVGNKPNRVVLVYPGPEQGLDRYAKEFLGARDLPEPLVMVRDQAMEMISEWGLRWDAPRETAYPAAYVIGPGRRVKWAMVSDSHAGRATVEEILSALKQL
jgi:peroxiredoxin